jgi:predicted esterase YcpF (UPF0227 family)
MDTEGEEMVDLKKKSTTWLTLYSTTVDGGQHGFALFLAFAHAIYSQII